MNVCQVGHKSHETLDIETEIGPMRVYDSNKYKNIRGYCTGKDDVSGALKQTGRWEPFETTIVSNILTGSDTEKYVLDFGSHIGWYSIVAAKKGYRVLAIDGDRENLKTLEYNATVNQVGHKIMMVPLWVDERLSSVDDLKLLPPDTKIKLMKVDIEGNEQYAVRMVEEMLNNKKIENLLLEISPIFNKSYPKLIDKLINYGYGVYKDGNIWNGNLDFDQANLLFTLK